MFFVFPPPTRTKLLTSILILRWAEGSLPANPHFLRKNHAGQPIFGLIALNTQISKCMRNGLVEEAQKLFDETPDRNTVTWNSMIRGYIQNGEFDQAVRLFDQMPDRDLFSYNTMISGLMKHCDIEGARQLFDKMPMRDIVSWNSMIMGCVNNSLIKDALFLFDVMPERNVISWNTVMGGLVNVGSFDLAEKLFKEMPVRDVATWTMMISMLAGRGRIIEARRLFEEMPDRDVKAWNTMVVGYLENGRVEIGEGLFVKMPERDSDSWDELINALAGSGRLRDALGYFAKMPQKSQRSWNSVLLGLIRCGLVKEAHAFFEKNPFSDVVSWTNMIVGNFEIGDVDTAYQLFEMVPSRDETLWNATIFGLGENDYGEEGLKLFVAMKNEGFSPDHATFTSVMNICSILPCIEFGKQTHAQIIKMGFDYVVAVCNALVNMYARCGSIHSAFKGFSYMHTRDVISWNSIICGFSHHGKGREALELFKQMRLTDVKPDQVTFIGVLSACSHGGLLYAGQCYFSYMRYKCFLKPTHEHYTCLVDLFGRSGFVEEAMKFINQMKVDGIEVTASVWGALLGACRMHKNVEIGEIAGTKVLEMEPQNSGAYMILAEIYLAGGRKKDAESIWVLMKERRVKKQPGCSWIGVKDRVHVFLAGDCSHPEVNGIYIMLDLLSADMELGMI